MAGGVSAAEAISSAIRSQLRISAQRQPPRRQWPIQQWSEYAIEHCEHRTSHPPSETLLGFAFRGLWPPSARRRLDNRSNADEWCYNLRHDKKGRVF